MIALLATLSFAGCAANVEIDRAKGVSEQEVDPSTGEYLGPVGPGPTIVGEPTPLQVAELQLYVIPFGRKVRTLPGFSYLYIEHEPRWRVIVAFTRPPPLAEIRKLAQQSIRERVAVRSAKRSEAQINAAQDQINASLKPLGVDYTGGYDPRTETFYLTAGTVADATRIRATLPPAVRGDVAVQVGPLPVPE